MSAFLSVLSLIVSPITKAVSKYQERKDKKEERADAIKNAANLAQIKRIESGDNNATMLDKLSIETRGWKDEYLLILTTLPLFLSFVPEYSHYVHQGFKVLESVPEYYWYALAMIYIDTFGFRRMLRVGLDHYLEKKSKVL